MARNKYNHQMMTAQRVVNITPKNWTPEHAGVPHGSIGVYGCCQRSCGRLNHLVLHHGEYLFKHIKCDCGHVMCQHCCSEVVQFDTKKELRVEPVKVPVPETEPPYFSVCPGCGLSYRAKAVNSAGIFNSPMATLKFKAWGTPCDYCCCTVSAQWPRVTLVGTKYGVSAQPSVNSPAPSLLRTATAMVREAAQRKPSLRQSVTGSLRAVARLIASRTSTKERGEIFIEPIQTQRKVPEAPRERRRMDRDHNIPYDWKAVEYDGDREVYTYRDKYGKHHHTHPGNRYGPYIHPD